MAQELSLNARLLSQQVNIRQQIILEIEGIPLIFGAIEVGKIAKYGDAITYGDAGLVYGGVTEDPRSRPWIMLEGTTSNITQQINQDGGSTSVTKFNMQLVDKDGEMSRVLRPGNLLTDPLGTKAKAFINFGGGSHPEDSLTVISGVIDSVQFGAGNVRLTISSPDQLKRRDLFVKHTTELDGAITDVQTTLDVNSASKFILPHDVVTSFIRVEDEVIQFTGISGGTLTGLTRGMFGTIAVAHDDDADVESIYILKERPIETALKLMLSGPDEFFREDMAVSSFQKLDGSTTITNAIFFPATNIAKDLGLVAGDLVTVVGATNGANNVAAAIITSTGTTPTSSYIIVGAESLVDETSTSATISFKSKYNTLTEGCEMSPEQVNVEEHEQTNSLFGGAFPEFEWYLKDTVKAKEFIDKDVYYPVGAIGVMRGGKVSLTKFKPPIAFGETKTLGSAAVKKPESLQIKRTVNKNFFNAVAYKANEDIVEDKLIDNFVFFSASSQNRVQKVGNKILEVVARGLRKTGDTENFVARESRRTLDRFQFAAESLDVEVKYKDGFNIDIGDSVIFGDNALQVSNINDGSRDFGQRVMECVNKSTNLKTGNIKLSLLDTSIGLDGRFATIGPSSLVSSGATTSEIPLKASFSTPIGGVEQVKWSQFVGQRVLIYSPDDAVTDSEEATLLPFDPTRPDIMLITPISFTPSEDYKVNMPLYPDNTDKKDQETWKLLHGYVNPQVLVVSGGSDTVFDVSGGDISKFYVGGVVRVHNNDFSIDSTPSIDVDDAVIDDITGTTITVDRGLGFTPSVGQFVDLIGFKDEQFPYRFI